MGKMWVFFSSRFMIIDRPLDTESRGVSVSTLDTLSTSLIIYRAEAVFVGLGIWDLYAGVVGGWIRYSTSLFPSTSNDFPI